FAKSGAPAGANAGERGAIGEERKTENEVPLSDEAAIPPTQAFWVEGRIISSGSALNGGLREQPSAAYEGRGFTKTQGQSKAKKDLRNSPKPGVDSSTIEISLSQR